MNLASGKKRTIKASKKNILNAALQIVKQNGWQSLSVRKIASMIEYTAPVIYEHFENKEAILIALTKQGFLQLSECLEKASGKFDRPEIKMEAMWLSYWNFAFAETAYYRLMFGVEINCVQDERLSKYEKCPANLFKPVLRRLYIQRIPSEKEITEKFLNYWSIVHGLIAINLVNKVSIETDNCHILVESIRAVNNTIS